MDTEERLEKLEREVFAEKRRNRWVLAAVGLGVVGVGMAWALATITADFVFVSAWVLTAVFSADCSASLNISAAFC